MDNIKQIISAQIEANKAGLNWGKTFLRGSELNELRQQFINNRIQLKRIQYASSMNPAAVAFGESQVGKSYLVDNLLASTKGPLRIYDGHGGSRGFIDEINPFGGGKESTSLVSRFTTKKVWIDDDYPVKVMLMKPIDIVLTLCDTFFNDVQKHDFPERDATAEFIDQLLNEYKGKPEVQNYITEDEVYEMTEYFGFNDSRDRESGRERLQFLKSGESFRYILKEKRFFEQLAAVIHAVKVSEWKKVFGFLWNNHPILNDVFDRLINAYQSLGFKNEVYIQMDALLRADGTILCVDRLYELFGVTEVNDDNNVKKIKAANVQDMKVLTELGQPAVTIQKSVFCALAAELILKISDELEQEKPFLKSLDIVDFPGARSRENLSEDGLNNEWACKMLIRGKVAYLFNKYSQQYLISNLLFCHHKDQSNVTTLSGLLEGWIKSMIGRTAEERSEYMQQPQVAPLFLIGTKFNMDMKKIPLDETSPVEALNERWNTRFTNLSQIFGNTDWFDEWSPSKPFQNLYLLRAYDFSQIDGIFKGYQKSDETGKVVQENDFGDEYRDFIPKMKESFLRHDFVKRHFKDPEKSWNEVGTPAHDGSDWIIKNLTESSEYAHRLRENLFANKLHDLLQNLCLKLKSFYHDDNSDLELRRALESAGRIDLMMDVLFGKDKYFFSEFINAMLIQEDDLHDVILDTINSVSVLDKTTIDVLFAIRERANVDASLPFDENQTRVREAYHFQTNEELDEYLSSLGFTMEDVINPPKIKNFARIIVDAVEEYWFNNILTLDHLNKFVQRGMSDTAVNLLISNIKALYGKKLHVTEHITEHIHPYVTSLEHIDDMADMLADICAEMINRFINTMGTCYFYDELWKDLDDTVSHNGFDLKIKSIDHNNIDCDNEAVKNELNTVFDVFDNVDKILNENNVDTTKLEYFSNYHAYKQWTQMMKIAFLATCGIPKYDVNANNELRRVLVNCLLNSEDLKPVIDDSMGLANMKSLQS